MKFFNVLSVSLSVVSVSAVEPEAVSDNYCTDLLLALSLLLTPLSLPALALFIFLSRF
jgi:hypothetical protein